MSRTTKATRRRETRSSSMATSGTWSQPNTAAFTEGRKTQTYFCWALWIKRKVWTSITISRLFRLKSQRWPSGISDCPFLVADIQLLKFMISSQARVFKALTWGTVQTVQQRLHTECERQRLRGSQFSLFTHWINREWDPSVRMWNALRWKQTKRKL